MRGENSALKRNIILRNRPLPLFPIRPIQFSRPLIRLVVALFFFLPFATRIRTGTIGAVFAGLQAVLPFFAFDVFVVLVHPAIERFVGIPFFFRLRLKQRFGILEFFVVVFFVFAVPAGVGGM